MNQLVSDNLNQAGLQPQFDTVKPPDVNPSFHEMLGSLLSDFLLPTANAPAPSYVLSQHEDEFYGEQPWDEQMTQWVRQHGQQILKTTLIIGGTAIVATIVIAATGGVSAFLGAAASYYGLTGAGIAKITSAIAVTSTGIGIAGTVALGINDVQRVWDENRHGYIVDAILQAKYHGDQSAYSLAEDDYQKMKQLWLAGLITYAQVGEYGKKVAEYSNKANMDSYTLIEKRTAEKANQEWFDRGYTNPPYKPGTETEVITLPRDTEFVRVYSYRADGTSNKLGGWLMRKEDIEGLSAVDIANKYALPGIPTHVCDVTVPAGFELQKGIANGIDGWGVGGGIQYDTMNKYLP